MMEQDTVKLLRECDAGIKMGVASIDDVLEHVRSDSFRKALRSCRRRGGCGGDCARCRRDCREKPAEGGGKFFKKLNRFQLRRGLTARGGVVY